jgi:hypothetical protein
VEDGVGNRCRGAHRTEHADTLDAAGKVGVSLVDNAYVEARHVGMHRNEAVGEIVVDDAPEPRLTRKAA